MDQQDVELKIERRLIESFVNALQIFLEHLAK